jgi:hypothetical protein
LSAEINFDVPVSANMPEFFFVSVTEDEICNAVMSIKSNPAKGCCPLEIFGLKVKKIIGLLV